MVRGEEEGRGVANKCTHKGCRTTAPCRFEVFAARQGGAAAREALARAGEYPAEEYATESQTGGWQVADC